MKVSRLFLLSISCTTVFNYSLAQVVVNVRPIEIEDVLINPGMGFTTFQMFNGDNLSPNIDVLVDPDIKDYQNTNDDLDNEKHPGTSIAYFRILWQFIEPQEGEYRWDFIDKILEIAHQRNQKIMLRIAPYKGKPGTDVPQWYREYVGEKRDFAHEKWVVDPEDRRYVHYFGNMIRSLGTRYDGHPDLESIDLSIVGWAGEGGGTELLSDKTMKLLVDAYLDVFQKTPLTALLHGKKAVEYIQSRTAAGWRQDCLGDLGFWADEQNGWTHMYDYYPQTIIEYNMQDAWKKAAVTFESCADIIGWKKNQGYGKEELQYIIDQSLKWHLSSFNNKSSGIPDEWWPQINEWQKKMGYRLVLRKFTYPGSLSPGDKLSFTSWWENKGVAPCYRPYVFAIRLKNRENEWMATTSADITTWLPGDNLYDNSIFIPYDMPEGDYELQIGIVDDQSRQPKIQLAIEGKGKDGWYTIGEISVKK